MRKLLFVLVLIAFPAQAQETTYKPAPCSGSLQNVGCGHVITTTTTSAAAVTRFGGQTQVIRIFGTTDSIYAVLATGVVATPSTGVYLPANVVEYIDVKPNSLIAVRASNSAGAFFIYEMTK